jgi:hypothetical protein
VVEPELELEPLLTAFEQLPIISSLTFTFAPGTHLSKESSHSFASLIRNHENMPLFSPSDDTLCRICHPDVRYQIQDAFMVCVCNLESATMLSASARVAFRLAAGLNLPAKFPRGLLTTDPSMFVTSSVSFPPFDKWQAVGSGDFGVRLPLHLSVL